MIQLQKCALIEDHVNAYTWMEDALQSAFPQVEIIGARSIEEAQTVLSSSPDLAILDLGLPDGDGTSLIEPLVATGAEVVIATIFGDDEHLFQALKAGPRGYILKDHPKEELVSMLKGILDGHPPLSPSIARRVLEHFTAPKKHVEEHDNLTTRERDVLTLLAKGYTVRNVSELLEISYHTAAGYAKSVYQKLNVSSRAEATMEATRRGYVS
ncbi:MAG: response regulator [Pseudomonadales bacterium]|nr:response regulator [Pseudomonadales bacterium]